MIEARDEASTPRRRWLMAVVVVAICALPLVKGTMLVTAPYGDSHDGRNGSTWAAGAESLREDPIGSRLGAVRADGTVYANHPPGILWTVGAARLVVGDKPAADRSIVLIGLWTSLLLVYALTRSLHFDPWIAAVAAAVVAVAPFTRVYGTMVDTPMLAFPLGVATVLVAVGLDRAQPLRTWELSVLAAGPVFSWQLLLLDGLVLAAMALDRRRRHHVRRAALAVGVGATATTAWLMWAHGSLGPMFDQFLFRTSASERSDVGLRDALEMQDMAMDVLLGPMQWLLLGAIALLVSRLPSRRLASALAVFAVLLYCLLLSNGAANHDYWAYWVLLPVALGGAAAAEAAYRALARTSFPAAVRITTLATLVGIVLVPPLLRTTLHERVNVSSAAAGGVLASVDLPPTQETLWALAEFQLDGQWMRDTGLRIAHLDEETYRSLVGNGYEDHLVIVSTSCTIDFIACDRIPGSAVHYGDRDFEVLRIRDLTERHPRSVT